MNTAYYKRYHKYTKDRIFAILLHPAEYEQEALDTAYALVKENGWLEEYIPLAEAEKSRVNELKDLAQLKAAEEKAFLRKRTEFQSRGESFQIDVSEVVEFERILENEQIEFIVEETQEGLFRATYPTLNYYFDRKHGVRVKDLYEEMRDREGLNKEILHSHNSFRTVVYLIVLIFLMVLSFMVSKL
jgi:hypothetical protein